MNKKNFEKNSNDSSFELVPSLIDSNIISNENNKDKNDNFNIINDYIDIPNNKVRKSSYSQEHKQNNDSLFIDLSNESNDNIYEDNYVNKNEEKIIKEQLKKFEKIENIKTKDIDCKFINNNEKVYDCKIKFNNYKIILEILNYKKLFNEKYYIIPFSNILKKDEVKKNYFSTQDTIQINLTTKDYRSFKLKFLKLNSYEIFNIVYNKYIMPKENIKVLIPSFWFKKQSRKKFKINGWEIFSFEKEFELQNLKNIKSEFSKFQIIINENYSICKTYPLKCIIPNNISIKDLKICAEYRTKNRFPALTYYYSNNSKCIYRSSQNMIGIFGNKNNKDVELLTKISQNFLDIYDCRPQTNAFANKINNGGYENPEHYPNIKVNVIFCDMQNIHCVRGYYKNLCETLYLEDSKNLFSNIEKSQWYNSIVILIESSFKIYNSIINGHNVLVHCSDGWDRTTQLCSMSQILLEKRYRTIDGFINLIEKDWLSFGHQFKYRNNYTNIENSKEFCPIFIQFLDSLYQIMKQNYCEFEYNFDFLVFLAKECLNGRYGTFLFNNDYERHIYYAHKYTVSVWDYVKENEMQFINPIYNNNNEDNKNKSIELTFNPKKRCFWRDYFLRYEKNGFNEYKKFTEKINELKKENEIKDKALNELFDILNNNKNKIDFKLSDEVRKFAKKNNLFNIKNSYVEFSMCEANLIDKIDKIGFNEENDISSDDA